MNGKRLRDFFINYYSFNLSVFIILYFLKWLDVLHKNNMFTNFKIFKAINVKLKTHL